MPTHSPFCFSTATFGLSCSSEKRSVFPSIRKFIIMHASSTAVFFPIPPQPTSDVPDCVCVHCFPLSSEVTCDTSYGCLDVSDDESCNSPKLNDIDGVDANRWGWYIEPTFDSTDVNGQVFTFDMYAGAGQNDLANGALAGHVEVTVNDNGSSGYTLHPDYGYCFNDVHVHVGNDLPTHKKKGVTVAPGKYTQTTLETGPFYVIVHVGETCTPCWP